uniref:Uncharacterized protein n=1 Tax=Amphimedon queenslandica TaxID=400682 RepID=A0A1X7T2V3_AMPQE
MQWLVVGMGIGSTGITTSGTLSLQLPSPGREVPSLVPDSSSRPADIFVPSWSLSRPAAMDVTVISPLQQLTVSQSATVRGHALLFAEERKNIVHFEECQRVGVLFQPLAMETLGGWSQKADPYNRPPSRLTKRVGSF